MTDRRILTGILIVVAICIVIGVYAVLGETSRPKMPPAVSAIPSGVQVLKDALAGKPVRQDDFTRAFEDEKGELDHSKIERVSKEVGAGHHAVYTFLLTMQQFRTYPPSLGPVPESLRAVSQPAAVSESSAADAYHDTYSHD